MPSIELPIRTERLLLRPLDPDTDVDACLAYQSREDVCRFIPYTPRTREQVVDRLTRAAANHIRLDAEGDGLLLALVVADTGLLVGDLMLSWTSAEHRSGEIGYVLDPAQHGNGYVTEACEALLRVAFDTLDLHRVIARIDERNGPSTRVAQRLGMRLEATLVENEWFKGEWTTEVDYAILDREWRGRGA